MSRPVAIPALAVAAAAFWTASVAASPTFPATVDGQLMLTKTVEEMFPPQGCTLCHLTNAGGQNSFRPFGALVHQYGASMENVNSLKAALIAVEGASPQFIKDIEQGRDPNEDSSEPPLPTPQYGCSVGGIDDATPALAMSAVLLFVRRKRRPR